MLTPTIQKLVDTMFDDFDPVALNTQVPTYKRVYEENPELSRPEQIALAFETFMKEKKVTVNLYDLFAGHFQFPDCEASVPLVYVADRNKHPRGFPYEGGRKMCMPFDEIAIQYSDHKLSDHEFSVIDTTSRGAARGLYMRGVISHTIAGFRFVVLKGYNDLLARIEDSLQKPERTEDQCAYLRAMRRCVNLAKDYVRRYAKAAEEAAMNAENAIREGRLRRIADACNHIANGDPAESFFEAIQSVIMLQEMVTTESPSGSLSFGRMDQLLYPFYQKDLDNGLITEDEAQELIEAFQVKIGTMVNAYQNLMIGGCDKDRKFNGNPVSLMFIRATKKLRMDQPLLSMRYTKDTPDEYWQEAVSLIETGVGFPAIFNDDVIIPTRIRCGVSEEDAWDYTVIGCVEYTNGGMEYSNPDEVRLNWLKVLELMLCGGHCRLTGEPFALQTPKKLEEISSFDEFYSWYKDELIHFIKIGAENCNLIDAAYYKRGPIPLISATIQGCIENASDAAGLGPKYRFSVINNTGFANVVDSLIVIKQLIFEEKTLTFEQLNAALDANFEGYEVLHANIMNRCEKFGNDGELSNRLMQELITLAASTINAIPNVRGERFMMGVYTADHHCFMGQRTGATPDGRYARAALANSVCPVQGVDYKGPTAVIHSCTRYDHRSFGNGMALDIKFSPSFFATEEHRQMLRPMCQAYFDNGGAEVQFNVVDRETLLDAQKHPENHQNLLVRVSGFSAYFVTLERALQNEIIARTEYKAI